MDQRGQSAGQAPQFIVGIGASAGGLEALERVFRHMPVDLDMAFVVVQHLSPDFKSYMDELLARWTSLPVVLVQDGQTLAANTIFLMPPRVKMTLDSNRLMLADRNPDQSLMLPIDDFFTSMAQQAGSSSVGIILSGTGSDGSRGIRAIHEAGGLVIAQDERTAKFDGMPRSARDTGVVTVILAPEEIGDVLKDYHAHGERETLAENRRVVEVEPDGLTTIFRLLNSSYGIDFAHYKPSTIARRTERRMLMCRYDGLSEYVNRLLNDKDELDLLYHDLLIGVTQFFRDSEMFAILANGLLSNLLKTFQTEAELRVWIAGCATGEEAYSVAILLSEAMNQLEAPRPVLRIFATDVHRESLSVASRGVYSAESLSDVSDERLARLFSKTDSGSFRVKQALRQGIVFAEHNLIKDAPFNQIHLVMCRNLLIYFQQQAQRRAISSLYYALIPGGLLVLGPSESPGELSRAFETVDDRWRIFRKTANLRIPLDLRLPLPETSDDSTSLARRDREKQRPTAISTTTDGMLIGVYDSLLEEYMPPALLIDGSQRLLHKFAGAGRYLQEPDGRSTPDILNRFDPNLRVVMSYTIQRAMRDQAPISHITTLNGVDHTENLRVAVKPVRSRRDHAMTYLITFETMGRRQPAVLEAPETSDKHQLEHEPFDQAAAQKIKVLTEELQYIKESLQATIEELETSNEELQATNEELVASNEELQSTNEELNSVNEELYTVNAEYQNKITELTEMTADMEHLLRSTEVHTLFLDESLRIRKFTQGMADLFHLMPQDLGRRFDSFTHVIFDRDNLAQDIRDVIKSGRALQVETRGFEETWYFLRILPYRTDEEIEGAVFTLVDITELKQAQADLVESRRRYQDLYDHAPDMYLTIDARTEKVLDCNRTLATTIRLDREQIIGQPALNLIATEDHDAARTEFGRFRQTGTIRGAELKVVRSDGSTMDVGWNATALLDQQGSILASRSVWRVITEQKRVVEALRVSQERFEYAIQGTEDGIWDWPDFQEDAQWWSPKLFDLLGYSCDEISATHSIWKALLHPEDRQRALDHLQDCLVQERTYTDEYRLQTRSGEYRWFRARAKVMIDALGRRRRMAGSLSDVTSTKQVQQDLARLNVRLQSIMDAALDVGIIATDAHGILVAFNTGACRMLGYQPDEVIGQVSPIHFHDPDEIRNRAKEIDKECESTAVDLLEVLVRCTRSDHDQLGEWTYRRRDGSHITVSLAATPRIVEGKVDGYLVMAVDITARKHAESQAHEAVRRRDDFIAVLSHELRNPLAAISSGLELLRTRQIPDPDHCQEVIVRQVGQLTRIVDDLLSTSQVETGKVVLQTELTDLWEIVQRSIEATEVQLNLNEQCLVATTPKVRLPVIADDSRIEQVIVNLLTNAIKFSPPEATINLVGRRHLAQQIAEIQVIDPGSGIDPSQLEVIFEPFSQVHRSEQGNGSGLGLGLTLSRRLVEMHGGTLTASSTGLGQGSTLTLTLPLADTQVKREGQTKSPIDPRISKNRRVLVVDDHDALAVFMKTYLENAGHEVTIAGDGTQAITTALQFQPDVLLVDIGLPGQDGYQVVKQLRREKSLELATFVAVSGYGSPRDIERSLDSGFDYHLTKPIRLEQIAEILA